MMRTRLTRQPEQSGAKRLIERCRSKLVCVRYRYDEQLGKRFKTVVIVEESPYFPSRLKLRPDTIVGVRISIGEGDLQWKAKQAGASGTANDGSGKFATTASWHWDWKIESKWKSDL